ncbi:anthrax toxin lethal factor-related metalloendopeptidase [Pseudoneobacillus sp. C159]
MKKLPIFFSVLILSLSIYRISHATNDSRRLSDFSKDTILQKTLEEIPANVLENIITFPKATFDQLEAAKIVNHISLLSPKLLGKMNQKRIIVKLFVGKLTDNPTASHLKGVIPRGYQSNTTWDDVPGIGGGKTVLVKIGSSEKGKGHGSINLELHELAHSIDHIILNDLRNNHTFLMIWEQEKASLFPNQSYFLNYPEEYFAETFAMYYYSDETRQTLYQFAPLTYDFIYRETQ